MLTCVISTSSSIQAKYICPFYLDHMEKQGFNAATDVLQENPQRD
jgi:hypothetical protein